MGNRYVKGDTPTSQDIQDGKYLKADGTWDTPSGGGGGASTFADLDDVSFSNLQNGQVPKYNSTTQKWENANESGGGGTVTDVEVDGVSVVNQQGVAEIPAIPDGLHHYSTTEQVIGTWIDGKPLYEKTIEISSLSVGSTTTIQHNISNFGELINVYGEVNLTNGEHRPMPMVYWSNNWAISIFEFTSTTFGIWLGSSYTGNRAFSKAYITLQYTKTTD